MTDTTDSRTPGLAVTARACPCWVCRVHRGFDAPGAGPYQIGPVGRTGGHMALRRVARVVAARWAALGRPDTSGREAARRRARCVEQGDEPRQLWACL